MKSTEEKAREYANIVTQNNSVDEKTKKLIESAYCRGYAEARFDMKKG